ncbi:hypothetical protein KCU93_g7668, partial [Aureobasidium melanogenum]
MEAAAQPPSEGRQQVLEQWLAENDVKKRGKFEELARIKQQMTQLEQREQVLEEEIQRLETNDQHLRNMIKSQQEHVDKILPDIPV